MPGVQFRDTAVFHPGNNVTSPHAVVFWDTSLDVRIAPDELRKPDWLTAKYNELPLAEKKMICRDEVGTFQVMIN